MGCDGGVPHKYNTKQDNDNNGIMMMLPSAIQEGMKHSPRKENDGGGGDGDGAVVGRCAGINVGNIDDDDSFISPIQ